MSAPVGAATGRGRVVPRPDRGEPVRTLPVVLDDLDEHQEPQGLVRDPAEVRAVRADGENYRTLFETDAFGHIYWNTVFVTATSTAIAVVIGTMAGYALARHRRFPGGDRSRRRSCSFALFLASF
jgi:ABC-type glycerol-3-phosphate transport system permease component